MKFIMETLKFEEALLLRKRNCRFEVCFTKDELSDLTKKARKARLSNGACVLQLRKALADNRAVEKIIMDAYTMDGD